MNWIIILIVLIINLIFWFITLQRINFSDTDNHLKRLIPTNNHLVVFILSAGIIGFLINKYFQIFCQPVIWSKIILMLIVLSVAFYPLLHKRIKWIDFLFGFIQGIGIATIIYILIFGIEPFLIGLFIGLPLLSIGLILLFFSKKSKTYKYTNSIAILMYLCFFSIFSPLLLGFLILKNFIKAGLSMKISIIVGFLLIVSIGLFNSYKYKILSKQIQCLSVNQIINNNELSKQITENYIGERIIGMHFKYHTKVCLYDGWRPPLHDPLLVFAMWINNNFDPLPKHPLNDRLEIYKSIFPNKNIRANCSCANKYSKNYWNNDLLNKYDN